jgi:hypothetical protein
MIKLFVVKCFRNLSFDKTVSSLTEEEAILLSFYDENSKIKLPSGGTLHHFVKYRLGDEGVNMIMMMLGAKILKLSSATEAKIDSTPLEASRYDKHADYNPHYGCKMDKAHITMVGTYPVFMTHTKGLAGDSPELINHIEALKKMNADIEFYSADGGYDSFLNHSDIWYHLNAKPIISYASDAVINKEGEEERINHWVNKIGNLEVIFMLQRITNLSFCMKLEEKNRLECISETRTLEKNHLKSGTKRDRSVKRHMDTLKVQYNRYKKN